MKQSRTDPTQPSTPTVQHSIQEFTDPALVPFESLDYSRLQIGEIICLLTNIYAKELYRLKHLPGMPEDLARQNAGSALLTMLPELVDKHHVLAYIACVAWGQRMRILQSGEAKAMIFLAQTQLSVLKTQVSNGAGKIDSIQGAVPAEPELFDAVKK